MFHYIKFYQCCKHWEEFLGANNFGLNCKYSEGEGYVML